MQATFKFTKDMIANAAAAYLQDLGHAVNAKDVTVIEDTYNEVDVEELAITFDTDPER